MKKLKNQITFAALLMLLSTTALSAKTETGASTLPAVNIRERIQLPESLKKSGFNEKVKVVFTVNEQGNVNHAIAATTNPELKKNIEKQFLALTLNGLKANVANSIVISFIVY